MSEELARLVEAQVTGEEAFTPGQREAWSLEGIVRGSTMYPHGQAFHHVGVYDGALAAFKMAAETLDRPRPEPVDMTGGALDALVGFVAGTSREAMDALGAELTWTEHEAAARAVLAALSERYELTPKGADRG